jgi:hypothetical protein
VFESAISSSASWSELYSTLVLVFLNTTSVSHFTTGTFLPFIIVYATSPSSLNAIINPCLFPILHKCLLYH